MNKLVLLIIGLFLLSAVIVSAQDPDDPGMPDSLIFGSVEIEYTPGEWSYVDIPIYFVADDSIPSFFLPITWFSHDNGIYPTDVTWHDVFLEWEEISDSIYIEDDLTYCLGWHDLFDPYDEPPLYTDSTRLLGLTVTFAVSPDAIPQICQIDTSRGPHNEPVNFGMINGLADITPIVVPGYITYGGERIAEERRTEEICKTGRNSRSEGYLPILEHNRGFHQPSPDLNWFRKKITKADLAGKEFKWGYSSLLFQQYSQARTLKWEN